MLGDALAYPRRGESWLETVGIGGILVLLGSLILIPLIPLEGYYKRVLARGARGNPQPPAFEEWVELTVDGIKMYLIQIAYGIVPAILLLSGALIAGIGGVTEVSAAAGIGVFVAVVGILLGVLAVYLIPVAMTNFAYHDDLSAAFDVDRVLEAGFTMDYFVAFLLAVLVGLVLGVIGSLLMLVLVGVFILFYMRVVISFLYATGYARALDLERSGT